MLGYVIPALSLVVGTTIQVAPRRSIGPFTAQVTLEERHVDEMVITDHPVESGAVITDHAYLLPSEVTIRCGWSDSPKAGDEVGVGTLANFAQSLGGKTITRALQIGAAITSVMSNIGADGQTSGNPTQMYKNMLELQRQRIPFELATGKRIYQNMLVKSLQVTTDPASENILMCTVVCREIQIVNTSVVAVGAPPENQADPSSTQSTTEKGTKNLAEGSNYNAASGAASMAGSTAGS